jgi:hypothetical protein
MYKKGILKQRLAIKAAKVSGAKVGRAGKDLGKSLAASSDVLLLLWVKTVSQKHEGAAGLEKAHHHLPQFIVLDRFGDIVIETCPGRVLNLICHCICRKSHDWNLWIMVLLLPVTDVFAGIVAILDGHLNVALQMNAVSFAGGQGTK